MLKMARSRTGDWLMMVGLLVLIGSALLAARDLPRTSFRAPKAETGLVGTRGLRRDPQSQRAVRGSSPESFAFSDRPSENLVASPTAVPTEKVERPETKLNSAEKPPRTPQAPVEIRIPAIELVAPIELSASRILEIDGEKVQDWLVPDEYAVGWHRGSARLGETGNTVLSGHQNIYGAVFASLIDLQPGDEVLVLSEDTVYPYQVANKMILPEKHQGVAVRMSNAAWLLPSEDERLTLVTCWPLDSNTHRLIIVARPSEEKPPYPLDWDHSATTRTRQ